MATKKGASSSRNGRDSNAQRLGVKRFGGQTVYPANRPGDSSHNWGMGWDSEVPDQYMQLWRYVRASVGWTLSPPGVDDVHAEWPGWRDAVRKAGHQV